LDFGNAAVKNTVYDDEPFAIDRSEEIKRGSIQKQSSYSNIFVPQINNLSQNISLTETVARF
jgi:hypothetical protein